MKLKSVVTVLVTFFIANLYSQKKNFEKGYYINSNKSKIECLIKNEEWTFNPTQFECIVNNEEKPRIVTANEIEEIAIGDEFKFVKAVVNIDKSNDNFENLTPEKALNLVSDKLLLRVRIEGKASLYSYKSETFTRFFYSIDGSGINQLSYKVYYDDDEKGNRKNEVYKQEILNNLKCDKITQTDIDGLEYRSGSLTNIFLKYNTCVGSEVREIKAKKNINTFEMYAKLGVGLTSFNVDYGANLDFEDKIRLKLAVEAEINLSNKSKNWSILLEPGYTFYSNTFTPSFNPNAHVKIDYKAIDLSIGLRHYFEMGAKSLLFANGYVTYSIETGSNFDFSTASTYRLEISNTINPALGFGYLYDKKYSIEFRYEFQRNLFLHYSYADSEFSTIGLTLGYKFL
jgi:hypothetical protein